MNMKTLLTSLMLSLGMAGAAHATLLDGQIVGFQYYYPNQASAYAYADNGTYLVGNGIEVGNVADNVAQLDISDSNLYVSFLPPAEWYMPAEGDFNHASFNGFMIYDALATIADFTSVTVNGLTNMAGLDSSRITFDANHIWVNWQGLAFDGNRTVVSIDINQGQQVPEPGTLALMGLGLIAALSSLRKRN